MKKFLWILILIVTLAGAYFWLAPRFTLRSDKPAGGVPGDYSGIPADWRTFSSPEFKVSFRYPPDWTVSELEAGLWVLLPPGAENPDRAPISVNLQETLPYERAVEEISADLIDSKKSEVKIGDYNGVRIEGMLRPELADGESHFSIFTMINRAGKLISIDYTEFVDSKLGIQNIYNTVLSSLTFNSAGPI